jgi:thymidylate kinase
MDGAGKSTGAESVRRRLQTAGIPAEVAWARLGSEREMLVRIGNPVKRLLRPKVRIADPVAAGGSVIEWGINSPQLRARPGARGSGVDRDRRVGAYRSYRSAGRIGRGGISVVCDRWETDALVDLELRYGHHRIAEMILRRLTPRPDLAILLEIDPSTAAARKPHDQPRQILAEMEHLYERKARTGKLVHVDARKTPEEVEVRLSELVDALVEERVRRETPGLI